MPTLCQFITLLQHHLDYIHKWSNNAYLELSLATILKQAELTVPSLAERLHRGTHTHREQL